MTSPGPAAIRQRVLLVVSFTVFLDLVGFGIVIPLLPLYVKSMGGSARTVGFVLSSFAASQLIATPLLGRLSDRVGRRWVILLSLAGNATAMLVFALAIKMQMLGLLFASRIFAGLTAGNLSTCQAAMADVTEGSERAVAMGRIGASIGVGMVVGPALGGEASRIGVWAPPVAAALFALLDLVCAAMFMPETNPRAQRLVAAQLPRRSLVAAFTDARFVAILAIYFLLFLAMSNLQVALALLAEARMSLGPHDIGHLFALYGLVSLVIQGLAVRPLIRVFGEMGLLIFGSVCAAGGMLMLANAWRLPLLIGGVTAFALGSSSILPAASSFASKLAGPGRQGLLLGLAQSSGGLARTVGPTWGGLLYVQINASAPFIGGAIAGMVSLLVALFLRGAAPAPAPGNGER